MRILFGFGVFLVPTATKSFTHCPLELVLCLDLSLVVSPVEGRLSTTTVMYYAVMVVVKKTPTPENT